MTLRVRLPAAIIAAALTLAACGDDPTAAETQRLRMQRLAGSYTAQTFTITESGQTTNLRAQGASLGIALAADGTTSGRLLVPGADEGGGDFDASMAGKWTLKGDTVHFDQTADAFVRDMPFLVRDGRLVGTSDFDGTRVDVTLSRD